MPVLFLGKTHELPGDADVGITFGVQSSVDLLLTKELVETVIGIVFADEKGPPDKMRNRGQTVPGRTVPVQCFLPGIAAVELNGGMLINTQFL